MAPPSALQQSTPAVAMEHATSPATSPSATTPLPFIDRILAAEHRFTTLTQNITHFSPLKTQLDKHNVAIERLENEVKNKTKLLQTCQDKLKTTTKRSQSSRHGSNVSLHTSETTDHESLLAQHQTTKEALESLNAQLLAAKILHIGLTRQVAQYFESRSELQSLLEEIFAGLTPEHPNEDALESEVERISAEIVQTKDDYEKYRAAKSELKEVRRYVDIWNDTVEKQVASNAKDVTKSLKKFVPFFGPKPPSYTKIADNHMANARSNVPTLEDIGLLSDIKMDTIADTSSELVIYTARFKDLSNSVSQTLETLHKRNRVLKSKRNQSIEKLFDERCRIFSEELQAYYRSVGESLVSRPGSTMGEDSAVMTSASSDSSSGNHVHGGLSRVLGQQRQHVENGLESVGNRLTPNLQDEELPSYFQHEQQRTDPATTATTSLHRRTFSLGSPACSSSASSSLSLHSPVPPPHTTTDSPPDYNARDERGTRRSVGLLIASGPSTAAEDEEDAQFRAYHERYDTRQHQNSDPRAHGTTSTPTLDMPPGYEEIRYHATADPI